MSRDNVMKIKQYIVNIDMKLGESIDKMQEKNQIMLIGTLRILTITLLSILLAYPLGYISVHILKIPLYSNDYFLLGISVIPIVAGIVGLLYLLLVLLFVFTWVCGGGIERK